MWALGRAVTRELLWGLWFVAREIERWRVHAEAIPDRPIREDALYVMDHKRTHIHGAALFWVLPRRRNETLLRLYVAYELIWDFLDNLSERAVAAGQTDGRLLHMAILEAVDPHAPISDYFRVHPWRDDGGYLRMLVECCRRACLQLPSYDRVRELILREASRAQVLALNHDPDSRRRELALEEWVAREYAEAGSPNWWELSGAASAPLTILALLALAAEPSCSQAEARGVYAAYFPWVSGATTMLDSYVDQLEDAENGDHSYVSHYPDSESARQGIGELVRRSLVEARSLRNGQGHAVVAACMIAMYLSKPSASSPLLRDGTRSFVRAGGSLTRVLLPILRLWRVAFAQQHA